MPLVQNVTQGLAAVVVESNLVSNVVVKNFVLELLLVLKQLEALQVGLGSFTLIRA